MDDIAKAKLVIERSGNAFHGKVKSHMASNGWHVLVSPYYMDSASGKPREIDLIAEKSFEFDSDFPMKKRSINIRLYIECKYIPQVTVFWFDVKNGISARRLVTSTTPLAENNTFTDKHHYLSGEDMVAKLFAGESGRDLENEAVYKAISQCLNAKIYNQLGHSIIPKTGRGHASPACETIEMPVIICNSFDKFYSVDINDRMDPKLVQDNFLLEVNYAYVGRDGNNRNDYFLIDVIDFNKINSYLQMIDDDVAYIKRMV